MLSSQRAFSNCSSVCARSTRLELNRSYTTDTNITALEPGRNDNVPLSPPPSYRSIKRLLRDKATDNESRFCNQAEDYDFSSGDHKIECNHADKQGQKERLKLGRWLKVDTERDMYGNLTSTITIATTNSSTEIIIGGGYLSVQAHADNLRSSHPQLKRVRLEFGSLELRSISAGGSIDMNGAMHLPQLHKWISSVEKWTIQKQRQAAERKRAKELERYLERHRAYWLDVLEDEMEGRPFSAMRSLVSGYWWDQGR